jgi:ABC-type transport system substrate-binding protein
MNFFRPHPSPRFARVTTLLILAAMALLWRHPMFAQNDPHTTPVRGDWVVIHSLADPESLNYITSTDGGAQEILGYVYEQLTVLDPYTLQRIPWIAEALPIVSPDHLTYDFRLNRKATFSDGRPVTGADFIFYLKTLKNPYIPNAPIQAAYYADVDRAELIDGDPYRLRVVMTKPYFKADQIIGEMIALPKHIWDPQGLTDRMSWEELNQGDPRRNQAMKMFADSYSETYKGLSKDYIIGSGPYRFQFWGRNDKVVLTRNENYWNSDHRYGKQYPDKIIWRTIQDYNAALIALKKGEVDFIPSLPKAQYVYAKREFEASHLRPAEYDYPTYNYVGYNARKPLFSDKRVRQALAHAIDRDAIIKALYFGMARPVQSPIYYRRPEYDSTLPIINYDLAQAKRLLAAAGWVDHDGDGILDKTIQGKKTSFKFTLISVTGNQTASRIANIFADALKKIGIDATSSALDWALLLSRERKGDYDAFIGGWAMDVSEADQYQLWHSKSIGSGSNYVFFANPRADRIIEQIRQEFDPEKRKVLYREFQKIIYDEQPYTFLVSPRLTGAYSDRFRNVSFFPPRPCYNAGWWWVPEGEQKHRER